MATSSIAALKALQTFVQCSSALGSLQGLTAGVVLSVMIAMAASFVSAQHGGPVMLYALLFGMAFNFLAKDEKCVEGVNYCAKPLLRIGVALLGARIVVGDVAELGAPVIALIIAGVAATITIGWGVGRLFKLESSHAVLSAGAVAICGASAALAISSVLPENRKSERNLIVTVVGVTSLSTLAMILYPLIAKLLELDDQWAGVFLGATIHDVAQVVGAGHMISPEAGEAATIVKLMRVACLAPAVMIISLLYRERCAQTPSGCKTALLPGFLIGFIALATLNSAGLIPQFVGAAMGETSRWLLIVAVSALGVKTSVREIMAPGVSAVVVLVMQTLFLASFVLGGIALIVSQF